MSRSVVEVEGEDADAVLRREVLLPLLEGLGLGDLEALVVVVREVGHHKDARLLDVGRGSARVGVDRDGRALDSLLENVFVAAELSGREDLDLKTSARLLHKSVGERHVRSRDKRLVGLGSTDSQRVLIRCLKLTEGQSDHSCRRKENCQHFFHNLLLPYMDIFRFCGKTYKTQICDAQ